MIDNHFPNAMTLLTSVYGLEINTSEQAWASVSFGLLQAPAFPKQIFKVEGHKRYDVIGLRAQHLPVERLEDPEKSVGHAQFNELGELHIVQDAGRNRELGDREGHRSAGERITTFKSTDVLVDGFAAFDLATEKRKLQNAEWLYLFLKVLTTTWQQCHNNNCQYLPI